MKRFAISALALVIASAGAWAQDEREMKTDWVLSALPCATYSQDLGFQYGAFGHLYYYGDGSTYPQYKHDIGWELSHFTKGRTRAYLAYDSKFLIPGLRFMASATYVDDPMYNFYGFNGAAQQYNPIFSSNTSMLDDDRLSLTDRLGLEVMGINPFSNEVNYYGMKRNMFRIFMDVQGDITPYFKWAAGLAYWNWDIDNLNGEKYGYDPSSTLYHHYVEHGLIRKDEAKGGSRLEFKGGVTYNSRDVEAAPSKGIWAEAYINGAPDLFGDGNGFYAKANLHFSQFLTLPLSWKGGGMVFAYHLGYQGTIIGETPWYMQQNINTLILRSMISEGFGSSNTIRGSYTSRSIAEGYAWANTELRVKLLSFKFLGQYFYLGVNPFFDFGAIVQPYRLDDMAKLPEIITRYSLKGILKHEDIVSELNKEATGLQTGYGLGLKVGWNQNFIVSFELGQAGKKCVEKGLGYDNMSWICIGVGYNF